MCVSPVKDDVPSRQEQSEFRKALACSPPPFPTFPASLIDRSGSALRSKQDEGAELCRQVSLP
ncbi:predicted protein [Arabidopsis lyrata subsp. lyrata]|uniref:Predicted protein n=1 Tax=Arabidopsis lyrata subsp. lyrata TaxID=81972 RepID=D7MKC2_ARALL|nr:predicted protein [Arabidopsis lyrata subsp. lyrata]